MQSISNTSFEQVGKFIDLRTENQATFMQWQPISSLTPNRLVFLLIEHMQNARWVGYVDGNGVCAWPEKIQGMRPAAWQEVLADLTRLQAISK